MKDRCYNKNNKSYKNYGGRRIKVYYEWKDNFINFYNWAIENGWEKGLQIDRKNNDGNYYPSNCRFVTPLVNMRNNRQSKLSIKKAQLIRELYSSGKYSQIVLGEKFGVTASTISHVVTNRQWV
jgi:hypothetical protein